MGARDSLSLGEHYLGGIGKASIVSHCVASVIDSCTVVIEPTVDYEFTGHWLLNCVALLSTYKIVSTHSFSSVLVQPNELH